MSIVNFLDNFANAPIETRLLGAGVVMTGVLVLVATLFLGFPYIWPMLRPLVVVQPHQSVQESQQIIPQNNVVGRAESKSAALRDIVQPQADMPPEKASQEPKAAPEADGAKHTELEPPKVQPSSFVMHDEHTGDRITVHKIAIEKLIIGDGQPPVIFEKLQAKTESGASADIEAYLLFDRASWVYGSKTEFVGPTNSPIDLASFLDSDAFSTKASDYDALICLGLESGHSKSDYESAHNITDIRATYLCGIISRKKYISLDKTKIFGLPLGRHKDTSAKKSTKEERKQRSVVIIGVKTPNGDLMDISKQQNVITNILKSESIENFRANEYSEVVQGASLRYIRIERGVFH